MHSKECEFLFGRDIQIFFQWLLVGRTKSAKQQWQQILQLRQKFLFVQSGKWQNPGNFPKDPHPSSECNSIKIWFSSITRRDFTMLLILLRHEKRKQWIVTQNSDNSDKKKTFYTQCSVYDQPFISNSMESCCEDNAQAICMRNGFCKAFKETQVEMMVSFICQNGKEDCSD